MGVYPQVELHFIRKFDIMNTYKIVYRDTIYFTNADNMEEAEDKFYFFINDPEMESFRVWITEVNFVEEDAIVF